MTIDKWNSQIDLKKYFWNRAEELDFGLKGPGLALYVLIYFNKV